MADYWKRDKFVQDLQKRGQSRLEQAQANYEAIANERLQNAARGEWSPWLAVKQNILEHTQLMPAERGSAGSPTSGYATQYSEDRDKRWEQAMKQAEAMAESGKGQMPKMFKAGR